jgi:hypothetical protein
MNDGNLYQAPSTEARPPSPPPVQAQKPALLQVFGILHLLAGGYGIITGLWTAYVAFVGNPFLNIVPPGPARDAQESMTRALQPMTVINLAITAVLVVLVIVAGIKLLRAKKNAVKASNCYAITSLGGKIAGGVLVFIYVVPAQRQMIDQQFEGMGDMPAGMKTGMDAAMIAGPILGILFTCLYPILALIFLNLRSVKGWLERYGK